MKKFIYSAAIVILSSTSLLAQSNLTATLPSSVIVDKKDVGSADLNDKKDVGSADLK